MARITHQKVNLSLCAVLFFAAVLSIPAPIAAQQFESLSTERWAQLREAERYQLNIAEKYYREKNWKIALSEYEKFLSLYEASEGAPYAQLKWSLCQIHLRKLNTAISDGLQSVIDYWPESPEAASAAYLIAQSYKGMGDLKKAKQAYANVLAKHEQTLVAVLSKLDLVEVAVVEQDEDKRVKYLGELTFKTERKPEAKPYCINASLALADFHFSRGQFTEGAKALETTYLTPRDQAYRTTERVWNPIHHLTSQEPSKAAGLKLADAASAYLRERQPTNIEKPEDRELARDCGFWMASVEYAARRPEQEQKVFDQLLQKLGNEDAILEKLADFYKRQNKLDEARATYAKYTNNVEGLKRTAQAYRDFQKFDQAIATLRQLSSADEKNAWQYDRTIAEILRQQHKWDEAVALYRDLIGRDPGRVNDYQWAIAETYHHANRFQDAINNYRQVDHFPEQLKRMADCHRHLKQYQEAILLYGQILSHKESAAWAQLQIGYTYEQAGKAELAIKSFQQVCSKFAKSGYASTAHDHLNDKYKIRVTLGGATEE